MNENLQWGNRCNDATLLWPDYDYEWILMVAAIMRHDTTALMVKCETDLKRLAKYNNYMIMIICSV